MEMLQGVKAPIIVALNKADRLTSEELTMK